MYNPSSEDLKKIAKSKYTLVSLVAKRTRQLIDGKEPLIDVDEGENKVTVALEEAVEGKITFISNYDEEEL